MQFANIRHWAAADRLQRLVRKKVAMICAFTVGFEKVLKELIFLLVALSGLIDTLLHSC